MEPVNGRKDLKRMGIANIGLESLGNCKMGNWVRVCVPHISGFLGPQFSKQESPFRQIILEHWWVWQKLANNGAVVKKLVMMIIDHMKFLP